MELTADQHADLSYDLVTLGGAASPDGGRFTSGQFGKVWRCGRCEQVARDQLIALLRGTFRG